MKIFLDRYKVLFFILFLAGFLRLWQISSVPSNNSLDEASIGYNAYSVLKTGGDEYGQLPIISQRGYDDYRRAIYLNLVIPFVSIFGLNVTAVRLPAVILSLLTIAAVYFLVKELLGEGQLPEISSLLMAISPWHIYISRLGHETNAYLTFFVFGILFFLIGLRRSRMIILSAVFFILSMVSYYSGQVLVPLFVFGLLIIFGKKLFPKILYDKKIIISLIILSLIVIPIFLDLFSEKAMIRYQGTSIFKAVRESSEFFETIKERDKAIKNNDFFGAVVKSRQVFFTEVFLKAYFSHFRPSWLFFNFHSDSHKVPNLGLFYLWQAPLILLGALTLFLNKKIDLKIKLFFLIWLLFSPLSASIATQAPHAMRTYPLLPVLEIFSAFGLVFIFTKYKRYNYIFLPILAVLIILSLLNFYKNYFVIFPKEQSRSFQYALKEAINYVKQVDNQYDKIVFSNRDNLYQSYMFHLFYTKYDPKLYQQQGGTISGGFAETHKFGKYEFRPIKWSQEEKNDKILYVGNPSDIPIVGKSFFYLDGAEGIKLSN